jgi:sec-independent protein translocase protein TatA
MFGIGVPELVLILIVALIFIGPQKLPQVARMFGKSYREFQGALDGVKRDFHEAGDSIKQDVEASLAEEHPDDVHLAHHPEKKTDSLPGK